MSLKRPITADSIRDGAFDIGAGQANEVAYQLLTQEPTYNYKATPVAVCRMCGAAVGSETLHDRWHEAVARLA